MLFANMNPNMHSIHTLKLTALDETEFPVPVAACSRDSCLLARSRATRTCSRKGHSATRYQYSLCLGPLESSNGSDSRLKHRHQDMYPTTRSGPMFYQRFTSREIRTDRYARMIWDRIGTYIQATSALFRLRALEFETVIFKIYLTVSRRTACSEHQIL
jgi:hypothetical protein